MVHYKSEINMLNNKRVANYIYNISLDKKIGLFLASIREIINQSPLVALPQLLLVAANS